MNERSKTINKPEASVLLPVLIIVSGSFAVYFKTLFYDFVYDDVSQVLNNPWITDFRHIPDMFFKSVWGFLPVPSVSNHYRPLMHVIYMVNYHIFGLHPWGFHLVNVLFHAANSVLVFFLTARLLGVSPPHLRSDHNSPFPPLILRGGADRLGRSAGAEGGGVTFTIHVSRFTFHGSHVFAFLAALLFATHPIHTEAVAWVAAVTDLSFTFFYLLSLYCWIRYSENLPEPTMKYRESSFPLVGNPSETNPPLHPSREGTMKDAGPCLPAGRHAGMTGKSNRNPFFVFSLVSFSFALLCKEPAATLPLVLLAYDISIGKSGRGLADRIKSYVPYAVIFGIYFLARYYALGGFAPVKGYRPLGSTYQYIVNVLQIFSSYLELLILPVRLNAFRILNPVSILGTRGMISLAVVAVYGALTAAAYRKSRPAFFGLMLVVVPLLPVFYVPGLGEASLAERYLYLPSFGFVLLLVIILSWIREKTPRYSAVVALTAFALAGTYSLLTVDRNPVWKNNMTLFSDMVRQAPEGELPRGMLGNALMDQGKLDEAIEQYRIVITKLNPNSSQAHRNLGLAFMKKGIKKEAIKEYEKAVAIAPADFEARRGLVLAYEDLGLLDDAIREYRTLLEFTPKSADTHYRLAVALAKRGMTGEAVSHYEQSLAINPGYADAHYNLGSIYANSGQMDKALGHFEAAVGLAPDKAFYRNILGIAYGQKGLQDKAVEQFEAAVRLAPAEPAYRENLDRAKGMKRQTTPTPP